MDGPADPEPWRLCSEPRASAPAKHILARTFAVDVLRCDKYGGRRKLTAFIVSSREASELLAQLGIREGAAPADYKWEPG